MVERFNYNEHLEEARSALEVLNKELGYFLRLGDIAPKLARAASHHDAGDAIKEFKQLRRFESREQFFASTRKLCSKLKGVLPLLDGNSRSQLESRIEELKVLEGMVLVETAEQLKPLLGVNEWLIDWGRVNGLASVIEKQIAGIIAVEQTLKSILEKYAKEAEQQRITAKLYDMLIIISPTRYEGYGDRFKGKELATGSYNVQAAVYKVKDSSSGEYHAMKVFFPKTPTQTINIMGEKVGLGSRDAEALVLHDLNKQNVPYIPRLIGVGNLGLSEFLVETFAKGDSIADQPYFLLPDDAVNRIVKQLLEYSRRVYESGYVVIDRKPREVLWTPQGDLTVVDFGGTVPVNAYIGFEKATLTVHLKNAFELLTPTVTMRNIDRLISEVQKLGSYQGIIGKLNGSRYETLGEFERDIWKFFEEFRSRKIEIPRAEPRRVTLSPSEKNALFNEGVAYYRSLAPKDREPYIEVLRRSRIPAELSEEDAKKLESRLVIEEQREDFYLGVYSMASGGAFGQVIRLSFNPLKTLLRNKKSPK